MKVVSVENIPLFLKLDISITEKLTKFCKQIVNNEISTIDIENHYIYINNDKLDKEFINYYLEESKIQQFTYKVNYEDKFNIAKSVTNEIFDIILDNEILYHVLINSYVDGILKLEIV